MTFQELIAKDAFPHGAILVCAKCQASRTVTQTDVAKYFSTGWPKCCGMTMGAARAAENGGAA